MIPLQMAIAVVHFLELVQVEDNDRELLAIALRAIEFLVEVFVEETAIVEARQRVRRGVDLQLLKFVVFNQNRDAQSTGRRQHIDHRRLQRNFFPKNACELAPALKDLHPILAALLFREIDLSNGPEELPQELPARLLVETLKGLDEQIEKRVFGRWLRLKSFAGLRHQWNPS